MLCDVGQIETHHIPTALERDVRVGRQPLVRWTARDRNVHREPAFWSIDRHHQQVIGAPIAFEIPLRVGIVRHYDGVVRRSGGKLHASPAGLHAPKSLLRNAFGGARRLDKLEEAHVFGILEIGDHDEPTAAKFRIDLHEPVRLRRRINSASRCATPANCQRAERKR